MRAIIFDLDGTLYQTELVAVPAFQKTFQWLLKEQLFQPPLPSVKQIESVFGMTGQEFWSLFLPDTTTDIRKKADQILLKYELELIEQGKGKFYPDVVLGLHELKEAGWQLFIVSNGIGDYVHAVLDSTHLTKLFSNIYTLGDHPSVKKKEAVRKCIDQYQIREGYMVGDRYVDMEAGKANHLVTIGCKYDGFAYFGEQDELIEADHLIKNFRALFQHL